VKVEEQRRRVKVSGGYAPHLKSLGLGFIRGKKTKKINIYV
jgi:hypothetical protein